MTKALRPVGVAGLDSVRMSEGGPRIIQGPPKRNPPVEFNAAAVQALVVRRASRVVKRVGRMALGVARERAPVRKIFKGGRRSAPRFYSAAEAKAELPAFLRTEPRLPSGRLMNKQQAMKQLRSHPISTSRNRANLWQRTGQITYRTKPARDDLGNPRKDEHGTSLYAAMRDIEFQRGSDRWRLFNRDDEKRLTTQGRYELKSGRAISFGQSAKAQGGFHKELNTKTGRFEEFSDPGSEGQVGGALRRSVGIEDRSTGDFIKTSIVAGGEDAPYARFVEFGTRHAAAQPFLRPALKHVEGPYKAAMREEFGVR